MSSIQDGPSPPLFKPLPIKGNAKLSVVSLNSVYRHKETLS
jgi:hypothetical protein